MADPFDGHLDAPPGPCTRCDGSRWVQVKPAYALHLVPDPDPQLLAICTPEQAAVVWAEVDAQRGAARDSWYPCRDCNPRQFFRWAEGHWNKDHDVTNCAECIDALGGKRAARRAAAAMSPPERKDLA